MFTPIYTPTALLYGGASLAAVIDDWHPLGGTDLHYAKPPEYLADYEPRECSWIEGDCWSDFTLLQSDNAFDCYMAGGTLAVWSWLAEQWLPGVLDAR